MMTIGTVASVADKLDYKPIEVELSDYGYLFLVQDEEVVGIPLSKIGDLVKILETVHS